MNVKLSQIDYEHFHDVIELEVKAHQEPNLPSNLYSIAEASFSTTCHTRAIWSDSRIVGFLMYRFGEDKDDQHECVIWRFMIDKRYQNQGIGTAAMTLLMVEVSAYPNCTLVEIYYDPKNEAAKNLYSSFGFEVVGERDDGDVIAQVTLA